MLNRFLDDLKSRASAFASQLVLLVIVVLCGLVTLGFLSAAGFIYLADRYGTLDACLGGAAAFLVAAAIAAIAYAVLNRTARRKTPPARSHLYAALSDPMVLAAGLQVTRSLGVKRLLPIVVLGGIALGLFSKRQNTDG